MSLLSEPLVLKVYVIFPEYFTLSLSQDSKDSDQEFVLEKQNCRLIVMIRTRDMEYIFSKFLIIKVDFDS